MKDAVAMKSKEGAPGGSPEQMARRILDLCAAAGAEAEVLDNKQPVPETGERLPMKPKSVTRDFPVVCVGGSAGGLNRLQAGRLVRTA